MADTLDSEFEAQAQVIPVVVQTGGAGNDEIHVTEGDYFGGAGNDTFFLEGSGGGEASVEGGAGADRFIDFSANTTVTIEDFSVAEGDELLLDTFADYDVTLIGDRITLQNEFDTTIHILADPADFEDIFNNGIEGLDLA